MCVEAHIPYCDFVLSYKSNKEKIPSSVINFCNKFFACTGAVPSLQTKKNLFQSQKHSDTAIYYVT